MRISGWSSDVCSSDLHRRQRAAVVEQDVEVLRQRSAVVHAEGILPGQHVEAELVVGETHAGGVEQTHARHQTRLARPSTAATPPPIACPSTLTGPSPLARITAATQLGRTSHRDRVCPYV